MKTYKLTLNLLASAIVTVGFQNCGPQLKSAPNDVILELSNTEYQDTDENFDVGTAAVTDRNFSRPGAITNLEVKNGRLYMTFYKGLKKKVRQGLGSRTKYYYSKWNFFVDNGVYLTTWRNNGHCGNTRQSHCTVYSTIENYSVLRSRRLKNISVQITTINDAGFQSLRTAAMNVVLPGTEAQIQQLAQALLEDEMRDEGRESSGVGPDSRLPRNLGKIFQDDGLAWKITGSSPYHCRHRSWTGINKSLLVTKPTQVSQLAYQNFCN